MSIRSNSFGRVTLTGSDAKKFKAQATYGRPKAAARQSLKDGIALARSMESGKLTLKLPSEGPKKKKR